MEKPVQITYDSVAQAWSAENPIKVYPGVTRIVWRISLTDNDAGDIRFDTRPESQGITFAPGWPGTQPHGDERMWSSTLKDTMSPNEPPLNFEYTVNAIYRSDRSEIAQPISWDPDVEEGGGPPPIKHG